IFAFDNATSHIAFAKDALVASKMNLGPGGSVPKMRDTVWNGKRQSMIIKEDYFVLTERGLWREGMVLECISCKEGSDSDIIDCCACRLMANQPDFLSQCGQIQQEIESHGHK
ncbi:17457_t:CDS:2, partial [Gigaspora margarita]